MASGLGSNVRFGQYTSFVLLVRQELQDQFRNGNEQSAAWREEFLLSLKINVIPLSRLRERGTLRTIQQASAHPGIAGLPHADLPACRNQSSRKRT